MKKRIFSILLAAVMLFCTIPLTTASAADDLVTFPEFYVKSINSSSVTFHIYFKFRSDISANNLTDIFIMLYPNSSRPTVISLNDDSSYNYHETVSRLGNYSYAYGDYPIAQNFYSNWGYHAVVKARVRFPNGVDYDYTKTIDFTSPTTSRIRCNTINLSASDITLNLQGNTSQKINATLLPSNTSDTLTWYSSNNSVVTVSGGLVKAVGTGTTYIHAYAPTGPEADCKVTVVNNSVLKQYKVSYNSNGGVGTPSAQTKYQGSALTLSTASPTKSYTISYNANGGSVSPASKNVSCKFYGWNTASNGSGTNYATGGAYTKDADVTLYAKWSNPTAGSLAVPTRFGYNFYGWYTSPTGGIKVTSSTSVTSSMTLYARWTDIYNLKDETYSFYNFTDTDSSGHCFGMSMTSAGYHLGYLKGSIIGASSTDSLYSFSKTAKVTQPICYYQQIQGAASNKAIVAGGEFYLNGIYDIASDWKAVVNYVKSHNYDDSGKLQIGFRDSSYGHAVNFLRYKNVNGQDRIYAYDNNFPDVETYFYMQNGNVYQTPMQTFSSAIKCICLRDVKTYFSNAKSFDSTHTIYVDKDKAYIQGMKYTYMDGKINDTEYIMYEIPKDVSKVNIIPKVNYADFVYLGSEYSFGKISDDTYGELKLTILKEGATAQSSSFTIKRDSSIKVAKSTVKLGSIKNQKGSVKITWSKLSKATSYNIYRKTGNAKSWTKIGTSKSTSYTDKTVKSGKKYKYTVCAVCKSQKSKMNETGLSVVYLSQPKNSSVTSSKTGITFKWGKVTGATGYTVYRKTGSGEWKKIATVKGSTKTTYVDKSAKKGITYTYTVRAYNGKYVSTYDKTGLKIKDKY